MNRVKKSKIIITIAMVYTVCVTPLLRASNGKNANGHVQDLRDSQAYQQGRYDEEHNKPYRENELYRLSRKKEAYRLGRQEYAKDLAEEVKLPVQPSDRASIGSITKREPAFQICMTMDQCMAITIFLEDKEIDKPILKRR